MSTNISNFEVAMLIDDIAQAKLVSDALREFGVFAHYYQSLEELWVSLNTSTPDLCLVDVKKMSQGTLLLKQHKKIQSHQLKCAFFYSEGSKLLLNSTFDIVHEGLVCAEINIKGQLQALLNKISLSKQIESEKVGLEQRVERLKTRGVRLVKDHEVNTKKLLGFEAAKKFSGQFGAVTSKRNFIKKLISQFSTWDACIDFGLYELNQTKQKLVSPDFKSIKFKTLPDLWLSKSNKDGIANYASEMAYEVCYGLMDENIKSIRIFGQHNNPDMLLIGRFNEEHLKDFDWKSVSTKLNSEYRRSLTIELNTNAFDTHVLSTFESFELLDDIQFHQTDIAYRVVSIGFTKIIDAVKSNANNRFHWKAFYADFAEQLEAKLHGEYKFSNVSVESLLVFLDQRDVNSNFKQIQKLAESFPFWRYFEDHSMLTSGQLKGEVKVLAPSGINVLRQNSSEESSLATKIDDDFFSGHIETSRRHLEL